MLESTKKIDKLKKEFKPILMLTIIKYRVVPIQAISTLIELYTQVLKKSFLRQISLTF